MGRTEKHQKKKKFSFKNDLFIFTLITLVVFILIQLASLGFFGTKGVEVSEIRRQQQELIDDNELLRANINELQSLSRVEKIAEEEFGMVKADSIDYISSDNQNLSSDL